MSGGGSDGGCFVEEFDDGYEEGVEDITDYQPAGVVLEMGGCVFVAEAAGEVLA